MKRVAVMLDAFAIQPQPRSSYGRCWYSNVPNSLTSVWQLCMLSSITVRFRCSLQLAICQISHHKELCSLQEESVALCSLKCCYFTHSSRNSTAVHLSLSHEHRRTVRFSVLRTSGMCRCVTWVGQRFPTFRATTLSRNVGTKISEMRLHIPEHSTQSQCTVRFCTLFQIYIPTYSKW